jgi:hypothetical protein
MKQRKISFRFSFEYSSDLSTPDRTDLVTVWRHVTSWCQNGKGADVERNPLLTILQGAKDGVHATWLSGLINLSYFLKLQ